jgi:hypothetical protein
VAEHRFSDIGWALHPKGLALIVFSQIQQVAFLLDVAGSAWWPPELDNFLL